MKESDLIKSGFQKMPDGTFSKTGIKGDIGIHLNPKLSKEPDRRQKHKGWYEFSGGKRYYLKSLWELHYANYLEFLKNTGEKIKDWSYEPDTFYFEGIKRGTNNYTPDFKVMLHDESFYYVEVKGYWDKKSLTKIKRMAKYHPNIRLETADGGWFKTIGKQMKGILW